MMKKLLSLLLLSILSGQFLAAQTNYENGFRTRAQIIIDKIADDYNPPSMKIGDPEKYYWPKTIARLYKYGDKDLISNYWIAEFRDNLPFHFTLVGMARIMLQFPQARKMKWYKETYLENVFKRTDSYNAWTSEGTENHINMSRTSGYLYAQEALKYGDEKYPEAEKRFLQMEEWLLEWSKKIYKYGTGEWNSGIYDAYNIMGWLNLYDFADDPKIRAVAKAVLDYYVCELALHYSWGAAGGTEMRSSGVSDVDKSTTNYYCWLWFGQDHPKEDPINKGAGYIQAVHPAISKYRPPEIAVKIARKQHPMPVTYYNSKPSYLMEKQSFVKQFLYQDQTYTMESSISKYGGWTGTTFQILNWKLLIKSDTFHLPYQVSGNGRYYNLWNGKTRNPWTQTAQYKNVLVQMNKTPLNSEEIISEVRQIVNKWEEDWTRDFFQRFPNEKWKGKQHKVVSMIGGSYLVNENQSYLNFPVQTKIVSNKKMYFIDLETTYMVIFPLAESKPTDPKIVGKKGQKRKCIIDQVVPGNVCGFVLEVHKASDFNNFNDFQSKIENKVDLDVSDLTKNDVLVYKNYSGDEIKVQYQDEGSFEEAIVDWGYGTTERHVMITSPPFKQPEWLSGKGHGRIAKWWVNGEEVKTDNVWSTFEGPNLKVADYILELKLDNHIYKVDYTNKLPVFTEYFEE